MDKFLLWTALLLLFLTSYSFAEKISPWKNDFKYQVLSSRPKIETRYTDATRNGFNIETDNYKILFDLSGNTGQRIRSFQSAGQKGLEDILYGNGAYLQLTDSKGTVYSSLNAREASRVNIYRRGPYYIETHWLDVQLSDSTEKTAPIKGEVVFYSYPEKTHIAVILHATQEIEITCASIVFEVSAETCASVDKTKAPSEVSINDFLMFRRADDAPSFAALYPVSKGVDDVTLEKTDKGIKYSNYLYNSESHDGKPVTWAKDSKATAYFALVPTESSEVSELVEEEARPLLSSNMVAGTGRSLGYDPIRGCYKLQTDNPGDFSYHYYKDQNAYETAKFTVQNNDVARKIYVLHETRNNPGFVECGVVQDEAGNTLPVTVQTSKNFNCEEEEPFYNPGDKPFSETIFPLYLDANERRTLSSLHLYQNWGKHPLKQFSSLGAWMDYYHMSTGVTETTCYVPFLFAGLDGVNIADLRPMSQQVWESQPQHDNVAGHSFLRYQDDGGVWHYIEYTSTTFRSTGPNWADMSMSYLSDDGKAKVTLDVFELPQTDELRNFIHMRVDFLKDIAIKNNDFARNLRLLNIASWVQQMRYTATAYGGPVGSPEEKAIKLNDDFTVAGASLPVQNGFAAIYPDQRGANAYIVRKFDGKINGEIVTPGVSVFGAKNGDTILMLVPVTKAKEIKEGDYIEADLFIMPYGGGTQDYKPAQKAVFDFGLNSPKITSVTSGEKISDFPSRVSLNKDGKAEFSISGGVNYIPIIVEGAKDYSSLRLYTIDGSKTLVEHSRQGEKDGYQVFAKSDGTYGCVFLVNTDGKEHKYLVESNAGGNN